MDDELFLRQARGCGKTYNADSSLMAMNKAVRAFQLLGNMRPLSYREQFDFKYLMILRAKYLELKRREFEKYIDVLA